MIVPCSLCGYDAPRQPCPHCGLTSTEASLAARPTGFVADLWTGLVAVPRGLALLFRTRGVKRWLVPPLVLTVVVLLALGSWLFGLLADVTKDALPDQFVIGPPDWTTDLSERWEWLGAAVAWLTGALEWVANHFYSLLANRVSGFLLYLLLGVLAAWYVFSIAYEAFAGPFLDTIQGRLEQKWFGCDPRDSLERPTDIPPARCVLLSSIAAVPALGILVAGWLTPLPFWLALVALPLPFLAMSAVDRRYGRWLSWIAGVEGGAILVSLKASAITAVVLVLALPLYFVPLVGYALFATVCGFATAISLLDIPCERRGWSVRQRLGFVRRHLVPFTAFGLVAGFLLAVPVVGWLLMVPSASLGGLWLLCRLDKTGLGEPRASR